MHPFIVDSFMKSSSGTVTPYFFSQFQNDVQEIHGVKINLVTDTNVILQPGKICIITFQQSLDNINHCFSDLLSGHTSSVLQLIIGYYTVLNPFPTNF